SPDAALVLSEWAYLTTALVGIGQVGFDSEMQMLFGRYLDASTQDRLRRSGAVGDICMRFYDRNGSPITDGVRGVIGLDLERLRRIPNVIAVAGGSEKCEAISGALRGGYVDTLVTDEPTAQGIVAALERFAPTQARTAG
ncbi:MAG: sugar-binding domain-containing protein, partial [Candidatus Limnocylindria bacterium]